MCNLENNKQMRSKSVCWSHRGGWTQTGLKLKRIKETWMSVCMCCMAFMCNSLLCADFFKLAIKALAFDLHKALPCCNGTLTILTIWSVYNINLTKRVDNRKTPNKVPCVRVCVRNRGRWLYGQICASTSIWLSSKLLLSNSISSVMNPITQAANITRKQTPGP